MNIDEVMQEIEEIERRVKAITDKRGRRIKKTPPPAAQQYFKKFMKSLETLQNEQKEVN